MGSHFLSFTLMAAMSRDVEVLTLLLLAVSVSCQLLDDAARARFDLILKDFGFSETSRATVSREEVQGDTRGLTGDPQTNPVQTSTQTPSQPANIRRLRVDPRRRQKTPVSVRNQDRPAERLTPNGVPIVSKVGTSEGRVTDQSTGFNFGLRSVPAPGQPLTSPGLSNLLAIAGDPQDNPVRGSTPVLNSGGSVSTEDIEPTPRSLVVRNRARTNFRQTSPPPAKLTSSEDRRTNPFINPALSVQQRETTPAPSTSSTAPFLVSFQKINKLTSTSTQSSTSTVPSVSPVRESRITVPRQKSTSLNKENEIDTEPQVENHTAKLDTRREKPRSQGHRPEKKSRPNKEETGKGNSRGREGPGCYSICDTLIVEVYQLLGG